MLKWLKNNGPGTLIVAAFIGPGTVTLCAISGAQFGYSLLWAILMSIIATIVLQEMAARVGIISQKGLTAVIKDQIPNTFLKQAAMVLIFSAIVIGNTAYEAGNISGSAMGVGAIFGEDVTSFAPLIIGAIAFLLLIIGNYKLLERSLVILVLLMSVSFIVTAIITQPNISELFSGMFIPTVPDNSLLMIVGIIGTTVVPYNLFLHSSLVKEKWKKADDLKPARKDLIISIVLGGLVSIAIMVSAASIAGGKVESVLDLAKGLEPLYGSSARYFLGVGLFAAGITSAITAPLAAAYVARSCFGWETNLKDNKFRIVWAVILILGVVFSSFEIKPIVVITFAQVANGLVLPIVALFLLWIVNRKIVLGEYTNSKLQNAIAILIILVTIILGAKGIIKALG